MGDTVIISAAAGLLLLAFGWAGKSNALNLRIQSVISRLGLAPSSALLVQLSGWYIETHFHCFGMLAVIALYFDWVSSLHHRNHDHVYAGRAAPEVEMPQSLDHLRSLYPGVELRYTWQFDLTLVANTLTEEVNRFS